MGGWEVGKRVCQPELPCHVLWYTTESQLRSYSCTPSDTSTLGVGAAVYAVIRQPIGTTQLSVAAKGRLAKLGLTKYHVLS